jgi:hypothetical protein
MTHSVISPPSIAALRKGHSIISSARAIARSQIFHAGLSTIDAPLLWLAAELTPVMANAGAA